MSAVLMNRDGFQVPADGFYQIAPLGDFAHAQAGLVQVVDREACEAMVNRFQEEAKSDHFAGLLVDFDHFSLDGEKRSEAAGWITALENRDGGLFAKIRWSDVGEEAVKGGRYRFLSPVWARSDCTDLGPSTGSGQGMRRVRPMRLLNAAVTNDPNLKGMLPLSNSGSKAEGCRVKADGGADANFQHPPSNVQLPTGDGEIGHEKAQKTQKGGGLVANVGGAERFQWVLGDTKDGRHCPTCSRLAGQVHTMAEWDAAGLRPGGAGLCCQGNCQCHLEETDEGSRGTLANTGWTNEARQASIEVRRAKASRRAQSGAAPARKDRAAERQRDSLDKASKDYAAIYEQKGLDGMSAEEQEYMTARVGQRMRNGSELTPTEERFVREVRARDGGGGTAGIGGTIVKNREEGSGFGVQVGETGHEKAQNAHRDWDVLTAEMKRFEYAIGPTGAISYSAPGGYHDDCVMALALANHGRWEAGGCGQMARVTGGGCGRETRGRFARRSRVLMGA